MKIKTLTLYNTKLDADYLNVIDTGPDTYLDNTTYKTEVLDSHYNNLIFYNGDVKSGQENNGVLTIRITKDYTELLNYNYVCINNGVKNYFYFITDMLGLNDSENPITEITLKRDAWSNNIEYFTNHQETDIQQVLRSHFIRFYDDGNARTFWPYYFNTDDRANITKFKNEKFLYTSSGNYVVWCWFRVSNDCKIGPTENAVPIKNAYFGKSYFDSAAPVYIFPVAILTGFTDGVPNFNFNITFNGINMNMSTAGQLLKAFNFNSDKFLEAGLTIYPPFAYNCSGSTITASNVITTTASILNELNEVIYNPADDFAQICYVVVSSASTAYTTLTYEYTNELTGFAVDGNVGTSLFDPQATYNSVKRYDPRLYCTPFVDVNFICANLSLPIDIIQDRTQFKAVINFGGKTSPLISCFLNDELISGYNNLSVSGNIPTSANKWESFLSKTITTVGLNTIGATLNGAMTGGGAGAAMGAIGGIVSGATNTINNMVDIASRPTPTSQPSEIASDNLPRHIPKIVINKWVSEREIEGICGELYTYGYKYRTTRSVKYNCRIWFDYCQTEQCKLPDIINLNDRTELEQAFNRGITKWHYDIAFGINSNFNKYQNNVERKYVESEDAQLYFKFIDTTDPLRNYGTVGDIVSFTNNGTTTNATNGLMFENTGATLTTNNFTTMGITPSAAGCVVKQIFRFGNVPSTGTYAISTAGGTIYVNNGVLYVYGSDTGITADRLNGNCITVQVGTFSNSAGVKWRRVYVHINGELAYENPPGQLYDGAEYYGYNTVPVNLLFGYIRPAGDSAKPASTELQIKKFKMYLDNYPDQVHNKNNYWSTDEVRKHII